MSQIAKSLVRSLRPKSLLLESQSAWQSPRPSQLKKRWRKLLLSVLSALRVFNLATSIFFEAKLNQNVAQVHPCGFWLLISGCLHGLCQPTFLAWCDLGIMCKYMSLNLRTWWCKPLLSMGQCAWGLGPSCAAAFCWPAGCRRSSETFGTYTEVL